jgi:hypothetical protein
VLKIVATTDEPTPTDEFPLNFETFWLSYPRHVAKKDAQKAWSKIDPNDYVPILCALWGWRRYWEDKSDLDHTPYPASWLRGERWYDELPPEYRYRPPKLNGSPQASIPESTEHTIMPEHVRLLLIKLKEGRK